MVRHFVCATKIVFFFGNYQFFKFKYSITIVIFYNYSYLCTVCLTIECFTIELLSITESEPYQRGMIWLNDPDQTGENDTMMWRT